MDGTGRLRRGLFALAILAACCPRALALDASLDISEYAHTAWKVRDGFTRGAISAIAQTVDGYLWLGTEFGLLRFDGVRSVPWQPPAGQHLPSNRIFSLLAARDGRLWIGTSEGLASWKDGKLTQYPQLAGESIRSPIVEDHERVVWVGGLASPPPGKLCSIQNGNVECYGGDGALGDGVSSLFEDSNDRLWVGVRNGLFRWKPGPPKFYAAPGPAASGGGIQGLAESGDGTLLFGAHSGIKQLVGEKIEAYPLPGSVQQFTAIRLFRNRDGSLWIGTADAGLVHVHQKKTDVFAEADGLSGDFITALFTDREGDIWAATDGGLDRFRDFAVPTFSLKQGLSNASILSVLADRDGSVWLSTRRGLNRWKGGRITVFSKSSAQLEHRVNRIGGGEGTGGLLNGNYAGSLFQDRRGRIWASALHDFGYLENGRFIPLRTVPGGVVYSICEDTAGDLWIANKVIGLIHVLGDGQVEEVPWALLGHRDPAMALAADPSRGLWIGFYQGGIVYFADGKVQASYSAADGLGPGRVNDLRFDSDGTLWAATMGGLSRLKNGRLAMLTSRNGLPCDSAHWVIEDDAHSFWLYTTCGLVRIARSDLDAWTAAVDKDEVVKPIVQVRVFDSSDGVRSLEDNGGYTPHVAKSADGRLWFLPSDGASVVDPRHLPFNKLPPPVHIEQVVADHKTYNAVPDLSLPPLVRDLEIDYTALSFVAPEKVRFRVRLEGYDRDWQDVGTRRQAFYGNLPPRSYRFRVMACNDRGVWNEAGASLDFYIAPEYYQTNWFLALCVAAFLGLLWGVHELRLQQVRREERKLQETVETMPTMAWIAGPNGTNQFVNRRWVEYTGQSQAGTEGEGWKAVLHPEDVDRHVRRWLASVASGDPFEDEARVRGADGEYRWFLSRAVALRDKQGKIRRWYGISTDIEDRKHAEQLQADLAHTNRVSMLGELAASISHELKQPITATITNAKTTQRWLKHEQPDLEEVRLAAERIEKDGARASEIIDRLRSLYKRTPPRRELVDLNEIIGELVVMLRGEANRFGVSIRTDLRADLPRITADRVQLQQVLMNVMLNGMEAMNDTGGVLTIKSEPQDGRVVISVSDTGVGLPADSAHRIFDAFFTTKPQGSGMGLAISRSIVESHGGRLWATPNDGRGASFHFSLPTSTEAVEAPAGA